MFINPRSFYLNAYTITVKTDNAGTSSSNQFTAPTVSEGSYNCTVIWGRGAASVITTYNDAAWTHTFPSVGTYTIRIIGTITGWRFNNGGDCGKLKSISRWGNLDLTALSGVFFGCNQMTEITAPDLPKFLDSSLTNILDSMFYNNNALAKINRVEEWTAPNTNSRTNMFLNCNNLNQNVSNLITSNVSIIQNMIRNCYAMDQDLSGGNFSGVTNAISFAQGTTMSTANYDALLNSLGGQSLQSSVTFHFGSAAYSGFSTAGTAHTRLRNEYNWTISDGDASFDHTTDIWNDAYDETTITESASDVSQWDDRSGNANHLTQVLASAQPATGSATINGKNAILFDADYMDLASSFDAAGKTIFFVVDMDDADMDIDSPDHKGLIAGGPVSNYNHHITLGSSSGGSWYHYFYESDAGTLTQGIVTNIDNDALKAPMIITFVFDTSDTKIRMNQNEVTDTSLGTTTLQYLGVGYGSYSGGGNKLKGAIGEFIVIGEVLNTSEVEAIESYLNSKWGAY